RINGWSGLERDKPVQKKSHRDKENEKDHNWSHLKPVRRQEPRAEGNTGKEAKTS
ncbi:unnamed protein product, partial [Dovyalis caffra]